MLKSDQRRCGNLEAQSEGVKWGGDADCLQYPETYSCRYEAFWRNAIDSLNVTESEISTEGVENQINYWIELIG